LSFQRAGRQGNWTEFLRTTAYNLTVFEVKKENSVGGKMADIAYVSEVDLERVAGPLRVAHLPGEPNPVYFSTHGAVAKHYGVNPENLKEPHATTLDYIVAATAG
jgi:hypothetical protein